MTRTAKRRFSRDMQSTIDGIAFGPSGPVLVHEYDPPAGDMWIDDVIPGKLAALDRHSGEVLWSSPCEVGYGRGFGAGFGKEDDAIVLGPSSKGHLAARMSLKTGELLAAVPIEAFDEALVHPDLSFGLTPRRIFAIDSSGLTEAWEHSKPGERYHHVARAGDHLFVVYTHSSTNRQGVLRLDAQTGEVEGELLAPRQPVVHGIAANADGLVLLTRDLTHALPAEVVGQFLVELSRKHEGATTDTLSLLALPSNAELGDAPLWYEVLSSHPVDEIPEVAITADAGKLYLVRGALLEVRDTLTGRLLGDWAVPGLDESVAFQVCEGAGLLAEEERVSLFELPA